jgi:hypothetical protein
MIQILKYVLAIAACLLIIAWIWAERISTHNSDLRIGTYEVEANDSVYIVTTRVDSVYVDTKFEEVREMRDN